MTVQMGTMVSCTGSGDNVKCDWVVWLDECYYIIVASQFILNMSPNN
jgi:hypothetical protein